MTIQEITNKNNKRELFLFEALELIEYFAPLEKKTKTKIQLFANCTNNKFREVVKNDLAKIRTMEQKGNYSVINIRNSTHILLHNKRQETHENNLITLFQEKFNEAKKYSGFVSQKNFAKHELKTIEWQFEKVADHFPVLMQWKEFLKNIAETSETKNKTEKIEIKNPDKSFSLKQIAIAYCIMGTTIDSSNAKNILNKHSQFTSTEKLIQKRVNKPSELTHISGNKTADTKHLKNMEAAKRLISGTKNKKGLTDINAVITTFKNKYEAEY